MNSCEAEQLPDYSVIEANGNLLVKNEGKWYSVGKAVDTKMGHGRLNGAGYKLLSPLYDAKSLVNTQCYKLNEEIAILKRSLAEIRSSAEISPLVQKGGYFVD